MKLTWFGGTALRIYIGGQIVVLDPEAATMAVRPQELVSGADYVLRLQEDRPRVDSERWMPPRTSRPMEEPRALELLSIGPETCLISAEGDPPVLVSNLLEIPRLGRWADSAVFVLFGHREALVAEQIFALYLAHPKHLLLAADAEIVDRLFDRFLSIDDRAAVEFSFSSLEPGLALEV